MVVRRSAQRCAVNSLRLKTTGTQDCRVSAIIAPRTAQYSGCVKGAAWKQDNPGYPILVLHVSSPSSDEPSTAVAKVRSRCECCNHACALASLSTFGCMVQRKAIAGAVSE
ncbi:hypothetical protein M3J09_010080 [Ascochyta lentis]